MRKARKTVRYKRSGPHNEKQELRPMHRSLRVSMGARRTYRPDTTIKLNTLGGWRLQAELVGRNLPAYTPAPSNPSSMGALVPI